MKHRRMGEGTGLERTLCLPLREGSFKSRKLGRAVKSGAFIRIIMIPV